MLHLLVADGNDRSGRADHVSATGVTSAEAYAEVLRQISPGVDCTLITPADADAALSPGTRLAGFDGLDRVIHVGGFSKTLSTGARIGVIAIRPDCAS